MSMNILKEANNALSEAKTHWMLMGKAQFMADVLLRMNHKFNPNISTARTDGYTVEYSPDFFMKLSSHKKGGRVFLVGHEVWHPTLLHLQRRGDRQAEAFNYSCDIPINRMLIEEFGLEMPEGGIYDTDYDSTWDVESIYEDILQDEEKMEKTKGMPCDMVAPGSLTDNVEEGEEALQVHLDNVLMQAVMRAEINGYSDQVPALVSAHVEALKNPAVKWFTALRYHMKMMTRGSYSTRKFNRRYLPNFFLPTLHSKKLRSIGIAQDTSGSVTEEESQADITEAYFIMKLLKPKSVEYIQWGTEVVFQKTLKKATDCQTIELHQGGGTHPKVVFDYFKDKELSALLIFTDGLFGRRFSKPDYPVIWVVYDNADFKAPFGQTIHYTRTFE